MFRVCLTVRILAVLMAGSLALAACGTQEAARETEEQAGWVVTDSGAGPIRVGMTADEIRSHVETLGDVQDCVYAKVALPSGSTGSEPAFLVMLVDGKVARLDVTASGVPTAAGARVGDTEARIRELYPEVRVQPHKYTDGRYLIVDAAPGRRLVFETDGTRVTRYRSGVVPQVDWVEGCS